MPFLTTYLDFAKKPIILPNAVPSTGNVEATVIQADIEQFEPMYLKKIFGKEFYDLFIAGLDADTAIYTDIRDGGDYVDIYGITQEWQGFGVGHNPIACYTYYNILDNNETITTGVGELKPNIENGVRASNFMKQVVAWNTMVEFNEKLHGYLYANRESYPTYIGINYYGISTDYFPTYMKEWAELFCRLNKFGF
jgi:hypothetical protein